MLSTGQPYFSIIIPTKNRSVLISNVINSILIQDFYDFEIIISDNSDNDATGKIISTYIDKRVRYFKTGSLSMVDNWNYGCSKASGSYLMILIDKYVMKPYMLSILYSHLSRASSPILSWKIDIEDSQSINYNHYQGTHQIEYEKTSTILQTYFNLQYPDYEKIDKLIPRGRNCCISSDLYKKIITHTGCFASGYAPDYSIAFKILYEVDKVLFIDSSFYTLFENKPKYSNGRLFELGKHQESKEIMGTATDIYKIIDKRLPIPLYTSLSVIIAEMLEVSNIYSNTDFELNIVNYYIEVYRAKATDLKLFLSNWRYRHHELNTIKKSLMRANYHRDDIDYILCEFKGINREIPHIFLTKLKCAIAKRIIKYINKYTYPYYT